MSGDSYIRGDQIDGKEARQHYAGREIRVYKPRSNDEAGNFATTNQEQFQKWDLPTRTPSQMSNTTHVGGMPFEGITSYRSEYPAHAIVASAPRHAPAGQTGSTAKFEGASTYSQQFQQHPLPARQLSHKVPEPLPTSSVPFEGTTSYSDQFHAHQLPPRVVALTSQQPMDKNSTSFDGTTTYGSQFKGQQGSFRPQAAMPTSETFGNKSLPFEGSSSYKDQYKAHEMQPRQPSTFRNVSQLPTAGVKFEGSTENKDQFRGWQLEPAQRHKSHTTQPPMEAKLPFEGRTTNSETFKGWKLPARRPPLGVELKGDLMYILIPAEAKLPAVAKQVFTTVHDNQEEMCVLILRGYSTSASQAQVLGQFDLTGLPPGRAGDAKIEVTFNVDANNVLSANALDLDSQRHRQWLSQGEMVARSTGGEAATTSS